jgi:hypothetical protein
MLSALAMTAAVELQHETGLAPQQVGYAEEPPGPVEDGQVRLRLRQPDRPDGEHAQARLPPVAGGPVGQIDCSCGLAHPAPPMTVGEVSAQRLARDETLA